MSTLTEPQKRALTTLRDALRRVQIDDPAPDAMEALGPWIEALLATNKQLRRETRKKLELVEAILSVAPRPGMSADDAPWRRLEDACRVVEGEIRTHANLRSRLEEGKRSMMPQLEQATQEKLVPMIAVKRAQLIAQLDPQGVQALRDDLPGWLHAWSEYAYRWYDTDFERVVEEAWSPREGGLPVPPPHFAPLTPPHVGVDIRFPAVNIQRERAAWLGGIFRHGRQGMMLLLGGVGLAGSAGMSARNNTCFLLAAAIVAIYIGVSQSAAEREKQHQALEADARSRAEQGAREMLRVWLERVTDKLNEDARTQLQARRAAFIQWYREQVLPAIERNKATVQRAADEAEKARKEVPKLQERARDLGRVEEAVAALVAAR